MEADPNKDLITLLSEGIEDIELQEDYVYYLTEEMRGYDKNPILSFEDIREKLPYNPYAKLYKPSFHIGHRKLFLTEVRFLCRFVNPRIEQIVLYVGAAPWTHGELLMKLFPSVKFILVDPNSIYAIGIDIPRIIVNSEEEIREQLINIKKSHRKVFSFKSYFSDSFAHVISEVFPDIYFISDIRTLSGQAEHPDSLDILWNMAQQMNWMFVFQPILSMLKFRHPYYEDNSVFERLCRQSPYKEDFDQALINGVDFISNHKNRELVYFTGEIDVQPWMGPSSTESRLIVSRPFKIISYGFLGEWEDKYFYYNSIARPYGHYLNPNAELNINFCNCNDCALENFIWENYLNKYGKKYSVRELVLILSSYVNRRNQGLPYHSQCYSYRQLIERITDYKN